MAEAGDHLDDEEKAAVLAVLKSMLREEETKLGRKHGAQTKLAEHLQRFGVEQQVINKALGRGSIGRPTARRIAKAQKMSLWRLVAKHYGLESKLDASDEFPERAEAIAWAGSFFPAHVIAHAKLLDSRRYSTFDRVAWIHEFERIELTIKGQGAEEQFAKRETNGTAHNRSGSQPTVPQQDTKPSRKTRST